MGNFSGGGGNNFNLDSVKEDIALSDLSDVTAKSGTGTEVPGITTTSIATNDYLSWNGTNWVNTFSGLVDSNHATGYAMVAADATKLSTANSGSAVAWTIPDSGGAGFPDGLRLAVCNRGAGILTITRTTASTINGATNATFAQYDCGVFTGDGTDWILSRSSNIPTKTTGTTNFLREDYTFAAPSSSSVGTLFTSTFGTNTIAAATTTYLGPYVNTANTIANRQALMPAACTARNLYVITTSTQNAAGSLVFTLTTGNGPTLTALTVTVAAGAAAGTYSDTVNTAAMTAGLTWQLQVVNNYAGGASAGIQAWGFQCN